MMLQRCAAPLYLIPNSHFHPANMENEVYSERSMSMHSLCSIILFRCLIQSVNLSFRHSVILQQTLIQTGRARNLVDKVHHFDQF